MNTLTATLLAMLLHGLAANSAADTREPTSAARARDPSRVTITWSSPPAAPPELASWDRRFRHELRPVLSAWGRMNRRLQGDLPALFTPQCAGFNASLDRLDDSVLMPAPDLLIDLYVKRLLLNLEAAGVACSHHELYNVVYRLSEAKAALDEVRSQLVRKGVVP
jgi:hypothetical protein